MISTYAHHFSLSNLPFGIASSTQHPNPGAVTRLGDTVIFLDVLAKDGHFYKDELDGLPHDVFSLPTLNNFAALPKLVHSGVRQTLQRLLHKEDLNHLTEGSHEDISNVMLYLPFHISDFTDFSCSLTHVRNASRATTGTEKIPPSFMHQPVGYQGRASSIIVSGTPVRRPSGHFIPRGSKSVVYRPSDSVDYELEFAAVIGRPLPWGSKVDAASAEDHIFGYVLLNDWSARDIQVFEMAPLGPLLGKNFATSISPWVVTPEALEPFRVVPNCQSQPAETATHLRAGSRSTYDIRLTASIKAQDASTKTCSSSLAGLFWTLPQAIAHLASTGCGLRTGDVVATGTVSGEMEGGYGCLLESTEGGRVPIKLVDGSERRYLKDGDIVEISAVAGDGKGTVGFGGCVGVLLG